MTPFWTRPSQQPGRAVFTMVRDEAVFLPIWLRYYSQHFSPDQMFVFDHGSSDGSVAAAQAQFRFRYTRVDHPVYNDFPWYTGFIQKTQRDLLATYGVVVFAEADEILWHPSGLGEFLGTFTGTAIRTTGWNLWHDRHKEPDLDLGRSVLSQRRYWVRTPLYDKPIVTRVPLTYGFGFHDCRERVQADPDLLLLHLHAMDFRLALQKHERTHAYRDYAKESLASGYGAQSRVVGEQFANWFDEQAPAERRQLIPEHLRSTPPV